MKYIIVLYLRQKQKNNTSSWSQRVSMVDGSRLWYDVIKPKKYYVVQSQEVGMVACSVSMVGPGSDKRERRTSVRCVPCRLQLHTVYLSILRQNVHRHRTLSLYLSLSREIERDNDSTTRLNHTQVTIFCIIKSQSNNQRIRA